MVLISLCATPADMVFSFKKILVVFMKNARLTLQLPLWTFNQITVFIYWFLTFRYLCLNKFKIWIFSDFRKNHFQTVQTMTKTVPSSLLRSIRKLSRKKKVKKLPKLCVVFIGIQIRPTLFQTDILIKTTFFQTKS